MDALRAGQSLRLESWGIGAGALRNLVWDHLHEHQVQSTLSDVDFAYFDVDNLDSARDKELQEILRMRCPGLPWEVTNQAAVHLWFEGYFGHSVQPLESLEAAVASWPEYATSVAVTLTDKFDIRIIAPVGLDDLLSMRVRRNPARVSLDTYRQRTAEKRYRERWPRVTVIEC